MPPLLGPGLAAPPMAPGSSTHTRWGLGAGGGSLGRSIGCAHPQVRACAEPRASPFSDLLAERGPSAKGSSLPPACRGGGLPTAFVQGQPRSGAAQWLGVTPVHGRAWGLRRGGVSGAEPPLPESLASTGPPPEAPDRGASPSPDLSGRREAAPVTALSALFEVGRLGASFKNVGFLFNFTRKTMV